MTGDERSWLQTRQRMSNLELSRERVLSVKNK